MFFDTDDLGRDYRVLLERVVTEGELVSPRGQLVREVRPLVFCLAYPPACIVKRAGFSTSLMHLEILQLLAGEFDHPLYEKISTGAASRMNSYGSYGPRTREQLLAVERELLKDPDSRRATVYVGRPDDLRLADDLNMPCTSVWSFYVRNGVLEMLVYMRSWDLVWGLSYDIPCFVAVQMMVARALGLPLGSYTHVAGSGHVYERHFDLLTTETDRKLVVPCGLTVKHTQDAYGRVLNGARQALTGTPALLQSFLTTPDWVQFVEPLLKKLV